MTKDFAVTYNYDSCYGVATYPKSMYKGDYTSAEIRAEHKIVHDQKAENLLRKKGFVDGKEFFSKPPADAEPETGYEHVYAKALKNNG